MKLVGRIPVEPLDDERMTNIERRIVAGAADAAARPPRESRFSLAFAVAAVAVVVLGAGVVGWQLRGSGSQAVVAELDPITVRTEAERSKLELGDATIESDPSTVFAVTRPGGGVLVTMTRGKVELEVAKRAGRPPLIVKAGDTEVIVVGTHFTVDYGDGTNGVDVRVTEGVVKVVRHQQEVRVAAGQAWTTSRGVVAIAELGTTIAMHDRGATIDDPATRGSGAIEIEMGDDPDVLHDRTSAVPDARLPITGQGAGPRPKPTGPEPGLRPRRLDSASDPLLDLKTLIRAQTVMPALDLGISDSAKAISEYRMIVVKETGARASHAFYSIAVVQALKLGRTADALQTLEAYKRRFSGGEEYVAALWLRVRIQCLRAIDDKCRQAAHTYLRAAPESPARTIAERVTVSP